MSVFPRMKHETAPAQHNENVARTLHSIQNQYGIGSQPIDRGRFQPDYHQEPDKLPEWLILPAAAAPGVQPPEPVPGIRNLAERLGGAEFGSDILGVDVPVALGAYETPPAGKVQINEFAAKALAGVIPVLKNAKTLSARGAARTGRLTQSAKYLPVSLRMAVSGRLPNPDISKYRQEVKLLARDRRIAGVAKAAGLVALSFGLAYLTTRGYGHFHQEHFADVVPAPAPQPHNVTAVGGNIPTFPTPLKGHPQPAQSVTEHAARTIVKAKDVKETIKFHGDTIWSHVEERVKEKYHNLSSQKIGQMTLRLTKLTLRRNHMTGADARNMEIGDSFYLADQLN